MSKFQFMTAGESHGQGLMAVVEGMVAGLALTEDYIARDLKRRQGGYGRGDRMKIEQDRAKIISGVRHGFTIGSPIGLIIWNLDWENWKETMSITPVATEVKPVTSLRPGHADLAGSIKYGTWDIRPILERSSARETAARVAVGAIARRFLEEFGIAVHSHTVSIGQCIARKSKNIDWEKVESSPLSCADAAIEKDMIAAIDDAREAGDTLGGVFEVVASGVPVGLGSHVQWSRRIDGQVARAIMSINGIKGVEIGTGFALARMKGSEAHDIIEPNEQGKTPKWRRLSNRSGGVEGGMTNGEPIVVRAVMKPIATMRKPLPSMDLQSGQKTEAHYERSDISVVPAAGVIGEAMLAIVLADCILDKFGGDNLNETLTNYHNYIDTVLS